MPSTTKVDLFKPLYKRDKNLTSAEICLDILDPRSPISQGQKYGQYTLRYKRYETIDDLDTKEILLKVFNNFLNLQNQPELNDITVPNVVSIDELPGLQILPDFFPVAVQAELVNIVNSELIGDPQHVSNLDLHYQSASTLLSELFEDTNGPSVLFPRDKTLHTPLEKTAVRERKLRWITLGGQYNWTTKEYPTFTPGAPGFPHFPPKLVPLFGAPLFDMTPEAAIVNFYAQKDTLSPHRDVAELSKADLVSVSVGCDAVFYVGSERYSEQEKTGRPPVQVRLRSGDVLVMGGPSRTAYHGVGKVWKGTSPKELSDKVRPEYREWINDKRVNINVRQMLM